MRIEIHVKQIKESTEALQWAVEKGATEHQRTIGFHTSAAAADMLEIYLHTLNLIDTGFMLKHEWLKSKNAVEAKLPFEFPHKTKILKLMRTIEEKRNVLCYGTRQTTVTIQTVLDHFYQLKAILKEAGVNEF